MIKYLVKVKRIVHESGLVMIEADSEEELEAQLSNLSESDVHDIIDAIPSKAWSYEYVEKNSSATILKGYDKFSIKQYIPYSLKK